MKRSLKRHRRAIKEINELYDEPSKVKFIHYAAESTFKTNNDEAPKVVAIAVLDYKSKTTTTFSINKMAELKKIPFSKIKENYAELEKEMLDEYFEFLRLHTNHKWVCWKMKDITYGFLALEFKYRVLGGEPVVIPEDNKFQMSDLLKDKYGSRYISKGSDLNKGRLYSLMDKNGITKKHLMSGLDESNAYEKGDFGKITKSTTSKVEAITYLLTKSAEKSLKTDSSFFNKMKEFYGYSFQGIFESSKSYALAAIIWMIIGVLLLKGLTWAFEFIMERITNGNTV